MHLLLLSCILPIALGLDHASAQDATSSLLLYGYPLLAWEQLVGSLAYQPEAINTFNHENKLQTADSQTVVTPNVDTLYSVMVFDLSHNDLIITMPQIPSSQFALSSYYDPYGNNFANIGPNSFDTAGTYLLTRRWERESQYGYHAEGNGSQSFKGTITSPTTYGAVFIRWLVNATNLDSIHTYQNGTHSRSVTQLKPTTLPTLDLLLQPGQNASTVAAHVLNLVAKYGAVDGPEVQADSEAFGMNMTLAGISDGVYTPVKGVNLTEANSTALLHVSAVDATTKTDLDNGWSMLNASNTGDYGTKYDVRADVAASGYEMIKAPKAIYPSWSNDSSSHSILGSGELNVGANESYIYTFSGKPPLGRLGFWSVTAYHDDYLIPNDQDIYTLGDRSNITYPHGQLVYGGNSTSDSTEFQILIQPADLAPPSNWTSNWLPAPSGGGVISALLRFYEAEDDLLNGKYVYPMVTKQAAIVGLEGRTTNITSPMPYTGNANTAFVSSGAIAVGFLSIAIALSVL